jgi:hypothetical protein
MLKKLLITILALSPVMTYGQVFPMKLGEAAVTCFSGVNTTTNPPSLNRNGTDKGFVVGIVDVSDPKATSVTPSMNWLAAMYHNELAQQPTTQPSVQDEWTADNLGQVFGLTLDDATPPNIYVTTTTSYGLFKSSSNAPLPGMYGTGGPGAVYRLDGATGKISTFATLPNTGPGLGDIAYDRTNRQFIVTNFDDGLIYRLAGAGHSSGLPAGSVLGTYDFGLINLSKSDPGVAMAANYSSANSATAGGPASGFRPLGQRPWAAGVYGGRFYFSVWANDARPNVVNTNPNTIWSIAITAGGGGPFSSKAKIEITLGQPLLRSGQPYSNPVSDIAFSAGGKMLVSERTMRNGDVGPHLMLDGEDGHRARVLEYTGGSGNWTTTPKLFHVGGASGPIPNVRSNSEGGVDYGYDVFNYQRGTPVTGRECDLTVWATAEEILGTMPHIYGLQGISASGNTHQDNLPGYTPPSYAIDLNGVYTQQDKSRLGDVEIYRISCFAKPCLTGVRATVLCTDDGTGDHLVTLTFTNLTTDTIHHVFLTGLPTGVTATPTYFGTGPVAPGANATIGPIRIHGATTSSIAFTMSIHNVDLEECCATRVVIELPDCDCAQITESSGPLCPWFFGGYTYNFTLQNLFPGQVGYVLITPDSPTAATFSPSVFTTSLAQYGSGNFSVKIGNVTRGQQVCFRVSIHSPGFEECCSIRVCVTIPRCWFEWPYDLTPLGDSQSLLEGDFLIIESPTKEPGVKFPLSPETTKVDLQWLPVGELPVGSYLEQRYEGTVTDGGANQVIAATRTTVIETGSELSTTFPALNATRYRYEFLLDGAQVGVETGVDRDLRPQCNGCGGVIPARDAHFEKSTRDSGVVTCEEQGYPCLFAGYTFPDAVFFRVRANEYRVNEVRVYPEDGFDQRNVRLSALVFQAHGPSQVAFTHLGVEGGGPGGTALVANLNTGYDQSTSTLLPFGTLPGGTNDDDWKVGEQPAKVIISPHPVWAAPLDLSRWISVNPDRGLSPGATTISFERCFCLGAGARDVTLDLQARADNEATVLLNGQNLGGPGGAHNSATPLSIRRTGAVGDGLFVEGRNCLRIVVTDFGVVTGLDVAGSVIASGGACDLP